MIVERLLKCANLEGEIYVDGANHPTRLSNTYRYYRRGHRGVVIEPNRALLRLHGMVRSKDIHLAVGCGCKVGVFLFRHASSHVLSGFDSAGLKASEFRRGEWIPVLRLDSILEGIGAAPIFLLSIDVEGLDLAVASGAEECLQRTRVVMIESEPTNGSLLSFFRIHGFELAAKTPHNLIFRKMDLTP